MFNVLRKNIMILIIILVPVLFVIVMVIGYVITTQRRLVHLDELCNNSFHQIAVQLSSRWDAVSALVKMTQQYSQHEYETLTEVIAQRRSTNIVTANEIGNQEGFLSGLLNRLMVLSEEYPELKAQQSYLQTMSDIKRYEENVRLGRMVYNDSTTQINRMVRQWPSSIVAGMLHFTLRDYLEEDTDKKDYPNIDPKADVSVRQSSCSSVHQDTSGEQNATVQNPVNEGRTHVKGFH